MKRLFDVFLILVSLPLFLPVFVILSVIVWYNFGAPIFFTQIRPGKNAKLFKMIKFRTMTNERDVAGNLLPDDERLTPFGAFLRSSSLDELPGLFNVLKGEMSLVGPRPLLVKYLSLYSIEQARRHNVSPGITGWAQVNGRNAISWEDKFMLDVWYVDNQGFMLDLKILFLTLVKVFKREGISSATSVTMEGFKGSNNKSD